MKIKQSLNKMKQSNLLKHETKKHALKKFFIVLSIFVAYLIFVCWKYGIKGGTEVGLLTWVFFVFCTPIADAGFLVGFPARILTGIRMIYSEVIVTIVAALIIVYSFAFTPSIYEKTALLRVFKKILIQPVPFWLIIILSTIGTFFSIYFADELVDVAKHSERSKYKKHKRKHYIIISLFMWGVTFWLYDVLLQKLGLKF